MWARQWGLWYTTKRTLTYAHVFRRCWRGSEGYGILLNVFRRMLTYADICWRMRTYTGTARLSHARRTHTHTHTHTILIREETCLYDSPVCWHVLTNADVCWRMKQVFLIRQQRQSALNSAALGEVWQYMTYADVCWQSALNSEDLGQVWQYT